MIGEITEPLPPSKTGWAVAYHHADEKPGLKFIRTDGKFDLGEKEFGDMLRIFERGKEGRAAWMVVDEVKQYELRLPEDTDRVISRGSIYTATAEIPQDYISA